MPVQFIVTGFGEFHGVSRNPTQALVDWLLEKQPARCSRITTQATATDAAFGTGEAASIVNRAEKAYDILSCTVLEVSATAVCKFLEEQAARLQAACSAAGRQPVVLLHLGVDNQRTGLNLELQAFNNATFRCPDQAGWQPNALAIEQGLGLTSVRSSALPVQQLAQELRGAGFDCHVSQDAGRFVCNYIYHKSLQLSCRLSRTQQQAAAGSGSSSSSSSCAVEAPDRQEDATSAAAAAAAAGASSDAGSSDGGSTPAAQQQLQQLVDACEGTPCYSLFVHVPSFDAVTEEKQQQFLLALLDSISRRLARPVAA
ncbi:hypothetical protein COO60DRAFT_35425 [Scenedesmus sp. NREL 46B-D3]|nr:hypothetical protein COO60DRAFT_35425 [Scenedesmus sp. NREL 46B-D3]